VTVRALDLDDDGVDATSFIDRIEPNTAGGVADPRDPSRICLGGLDTDDADGDGVNDTFLGVSGGTPVCFDVIPSMNRTVEPTSEPQVFRAEIRLEGDGTTLLDSREVLFVVPPVVPDLGLI